MAYRVPLIINDSLGRLQELPVGDNLDLGNSDIVNVGILSASTISVDTLNSNINYVNNIVVSGLSNFNGGVRVSEVYSSYLENTGILRTNSLSIESAQVISRGRQLQNILSIDEVTRTTLEGALSLEPNTFTSLNITGVGTFTGTLNANSGLNVTGSANLGFISATSSTIGISTVTNFIVSNTGTITVGGTTGTSGQYLRSTGIGVTWESFPIFRRSLSTIATTGQTGFSTTYNVGFLDVFVNGTRLTESEYTATNGSDIIFNTPCFGGEIVDIFAYSIISTSSGVGAVGVAGGGGTSSQWVSTVAGIHTTSNVGVGTNNPTSRLHVSGVGSTALFVDGNARITGILSIGTSSITLDGTADTLRIGSAVTISSTTLTVENLVVTNSTTGVVASGTGVTIRDGGSDLGTASIINFGDNLTVDFASGIATVNATGGNGGTSSQWVSTVAGIHTTSNVGVGTNNPTSRLHVEGNTNINGIVTASQFVRSGGTSGQFLKADGSVDSNTYLTTTGSAINLTNLTDVAVGTYGNSTTIPSITINANGRITGIGTTSITLSGSGANLTNLTGASAGTYGSSTAVPVIVIDANGRITGITTTAIVGGGGGTSVTISDTAPVSPSPGNLWYNSLVGRGFIFYNDGSSSQWVDFGPSVGGFSTEPATLGSLSVSIASSGTSTLSYNNMTGVFTFTPPNLSGYATTESIVGFITSGALSGYLTTTGSAANLTSLTGASSGTYGSSTAVPVVTVDANGRITGIGTSSISVAGAGGETLDTTLGLGNTSSRGMSVGIVTATQFVRSGGTSSQFLKADGSVDSSTYLTSYTETDTLNSVTTRGNTTTNGISVGILTSTITIPTELRSRSVAERTTLVNGNTVGLAFSTGGGNVAICTNPTGDITLNVTNIPTDSSFDNHSISFSVIVNQTGTARTCTAVTLNGLSRTIRWSGGSLANALSGVSTSTGFDIFTFTGINTVGSASTTSNYTVLGSVNGGFN